MKMKHYFFFEINRTIFLIDIENEYAISENLQQKVFLSLGTRLTIVWLSVCLCSVRVCVCLVFRIVNETSTETRLAQGSSSQTPARYLALFKRN